MLQPAPPDLGYRKRFPKSRMLEVLERVIADDHEHHKLPLDLLLNRSYTA